MSLWRSLIFTFVVVVPPFLLSLRFHPNNWSSSLLRLLLDQKEMGKIEVPYKTVDGQPLLVNIWYNDGDIGTAKPIALYFHGGSFTVGNKDMFPEPQLNRLLELGFTVVSPNYRLSPTISVADGAVQDAKYAYVWVQTDLPKIFEDKLGVRLVSGDIVTLGHSCGATLALLMASMPKPPKAIADFFGMKFLQDPFYHEPMASLAALPSFEDAFLKQIFQDIPPPSETPPPFGPNGPDFSKYRNVWLFNTLKNGTHTSAVIPREEEYQKVDPSRLFAEDFPPTVFVHGGKDSIVDVKFSRQAHAELQEKGVETKLMVFEEGDHGFEAFVKPGDPAFDLVEQAFDFLKSHL